MTKSKEDLIRAWKDEEYRNTLSEVDFEELAAIAAEVVANPAGLTTLEDSEIGRVAGGRGGYFYTRIACSQDVICTWAKACKSV